MFHPTFQAYSVQHLMRRSWDTSWANFVVTLRKTPRLISVVAAQVWYPALDTLLGSGPHGTLSEDG